MPIRVTLSSKGQLSLPKRLREEDKLSQSDIFQLQRISRGRYLLEKMFPPKLPKADLVKSENGFLVFRAPPASGRITDEMVKQIEGETI